MIKLTIGQQEIEATAEEVRQLYVELQELFEGKSIADNEFQQLLNIRRQVIQHWAHHSKVTHQLL